MEFIGKGGFGKGALWVALRLPEGHVLAHANQARITTFLPCDDENTCRMAPDVVRAHPNPNHNPDPNLESTLASMYHTSPERASPIEKPSMSEA